MKQMLCALVSITLMLSACTNLEHEPLPSTASIEQTIQPPRVKQASTTEDGMTEIQIVVGDNIFSAKLYSTQTNQSFLEQLPLTITMDELNGNEKFYYFSNRLPTDSYNPKEIKSGDLMLFGSDCLVLFYESFSTSYSYTRLGFIEDATGLSHALGKESISITFMQNKEEHNDVR